MPNRDQHGPLDKPFTMRQAFPIGRFSIKQDYDYQYVFVSLGFMQELTEMPGAVSAIEIKLNPGADADKLKPKLKALFPQPMEVRNKDEQNAAFSN